MALWQRVLLFLFCVIGIGFVGWKVLAEVNCDGTSDVAGCVAISKQIEELGKQLQMSRDASAPLESELSKLDKQIKSIQSRISSAIGKQKDLEKRVNERETKVAEHYIVFSKKTREMYKKVRGRTILTQLLSTVGSGQFTRELAYQNMASDQDRQLILSLSEEIISLEEDKKKLDAEKKQLAILQQNLDKQAGFFREEVGKARKFQNDLSGQIAALSAKQQEILGEKQGTFSTSVGDVPLADDPNSRPDYNPGFSPAFAAFSFGAPHFKGMSQYGAYGRAKDGQSTETILKAYYGNIEVKKDYDPGKQISVKGYGRMDIETYVKRVYEVPNSWGDNGGFEALKAQVVAARSYALAWTDEGRGGSICTDEGCQVYKNSNKGGKWEEAVNATRGWVLVANGKPFKAWFASSAGGYIQGYTDNYSGYSTSGFWDTPSGRSGWTSQAYEKKADGPWFYKGWYKSRSGASCSRSHPWLNGEEMADVINAWVVLIKSNQSDSRVVPLGGCAGGSPYSIGELRDRANGLGGGYTKVTAMSVTYSEGGYTNSVHLETDRGGLDINGGDFKKAFNLRAPGWISLKSGLFNIESK